MAGRPRIPIDADQVFKLACLGCTLEEIGEYFGCSRETVRINYMQEYELGRGAQKTSLRRWQTKKARAGCTTMLIHLGGVYLGQSSKLDVTSDGKPLQPIFERIDNTRDKEIPPPTETEGVLPE